MLFIWIDIIFKIILMNWYNFENNINELILFINDINEFKLFIKWLCNWFCFIWEYDKEWWVFFLFYFLNIECGMLMIWLLVEILIGIIVMKLRLLCMYLDYYMDF